MASVIFVSVNWSISFLAQLAFAGLGSVGCFTGANAQCSFHSAPSAIQRRIKSFSSAVKLRLESGGGIRSSGSVVTSRLNNSLSLGLPCVMTSIAPSLE